MNLISIDIDGILNDYPNPWISFLNEKTNKYYVTREEAKTHLGSETYQLIKDQYRTSTTKANLQINIELVELMQKLYKNNYRFCISTSRPIQDSKYPDLYDLTYNWLSKNNVPFNNLYFKEDSNDFFEKVKDVLFHIDDELKYAKLFSNKRIKTYLYNKIYIPVKNNIGSEFIIQTNDFSFLETLNTSLKY